MDKTHFFTLPHCLIFNVSIYSVILSNETVNLDWTKIIQTKVHLEQNFTLENFKITIEGNDRPQDSSKGVAKVEWTHSYQCIKKYMLRLQYNNTVEDDILGEIRIDAPPSLQEKVELDLHEIPGNKEG